MTAARKRLATRKFEGDPRAENDRSAARDRTVKVGSLSALAWTWFTFWEGWLFGYFLGWVWAVAWCGVWLLGRAMYEWGRKASA